MSCTYIPDEWFIRGKFALYSCSNNCKSVIPWLVMVVVMGITYSDTSIIARNKSHDGK